jgi:hypothetical protein
VWWLGNYLLSIILLLVRRVGPADLLGVLPVQHGQQEGGQQQHRQQQAPTGSSTGTEGAVSLQQTLWWRTPRKAFWAIHQLAGCVRVRTSTSSWLIATKL